MTASEAAGVVWGAAGPIAQILGLGGVALLGLSLMGLIGKW